MKFRYIFIKRWQVEKFRFVFLPSIGYSGENNFIERKRAIGLSWLCFCWHFEWYKERNNNIETMKYDTSRI